jgi:hypothetical protein
VSDARATPTQTDTGHTEPGHADPGHSKGLRPQKRLFIVLSIVMALWIATLVIMYFTTVWPKRHATPSRENDVEDHQPTTMVG